MITLVSNLLARAPKQDMMSCCYARLYMVEITRKSGFSMTVARTRSTTSPISEGVSSGRPLLANGDHFIHPDNWSCSSSLL